MSADQVCFGFLWEKPAKVPDTVIWQRTIKEAACLPSRAPSSTNRPALDVHAPKFEPLDPPRDVRADQRTYRLAISRPRALAAVRQTLNQ